MWKKTSIEKDKDYVLLLCEKKEHRFCVVAEHGITSDHAVYSTEIIPNDLIDKYDFEHIANNYKTSDGQLFFFGPHGEWLTESEYQEVRDCAKYGPVTPYGDRILNISLSKTYNPKFYRKVLKKILAENESVYCFIPEKCPAPYVTQKGDSKGELSGKAEIYKSELEKFFEHENVKIEKFRLPNDDIVIVTSPKGGIPVNLQSVMINLRTYGLLKSIYGYE